MDKKLNLIDCWPMLNWKVSGVLPMKAKEKILLVEDDEGVLDMLSSIFEEEFEVHQAKNGKEAYDMFFDLKPSIIVTDIVMPVMDGAKLTKKVKNISPNTTIFAITGAKKIHLKYAEEAGADRVFEKPGGMQSLYRAVNNYAH